MRSAPVGRGVLMAALAVVSFLALFLSVVELRAYVHQHEPAAKHKGAADEPLPMHPFTHTRPVPTESMYERSAKAGNVARWLLDFRHLRERALK